MIPQFKYLILTDLTCFFSLIVSPAFSETVKVKVGVLTDLSGPAAYWGMQARLGAELAVKELRASGKEIELIYGDHQLDAKDVCYRSSKAY